MLDWLILGGGVHGTLISRALVGKGGCDPDRVRVLDPYPEPLQRWAECTTNIGMRYLRSSLVHHLDEAPLSLERFSHGRSDSRPPFRGQYQRPSLELFNDHCRTVIDRCGLRSLRLQGRARDLRRRDGRFVVDTDNGALQSRRVVLALGASDQPQWPDWAKKLRADGAAVHHVFDPGFRLGELPDGRRLAVIGGGISALQTAETLIRDPARSVQLIARHPARVFDFDTDSTWLGPKRLRVFDRLRSPDERRVAITEARHRGSSPPGVERRFRRAVERQAVGVTLGDVSAAHAGSEIDLEVTEASTISTDVVLLATGFSSERPGGAFLDSVIDRHGLECAACGYPVVDRNLRWDSGLYVTGPLAELELGPTARNIHGARLAGERLAEVARSGLQEY